MDKDCIKKEFYRACCHKILPLVYDDSITYYMQVCRLVQKINEVIEKQNYLEELYSEMVGLVEEFKTLSDEVKKEIDDAIAGIDDKVYQEVNKIIQEMYESGEFDNIQNNKLFDLRIVDTGTQGDCFLLKYQDKIIMIDTGHVGSQLPVQNAMKDWGTHVDYLIITHFDPDHVNGVIEHYFDNWFDANTTVYIGLHEPIDVDWYNQNIDSVIRNLTALGCNIVYPTENQTVEIGLLTSFKFNNCSSSASYGKGEKDTNDYSLFVCFSCGNKKVQFCGDANKAAQRVNYPLLSRVDILALPHHGNYYSMYKPFLKKLCPDYGFVSDNRMPSEIASKGNPTHGMKRQFTDTGAICWTIAETGRTFTISMYIGNVLCDGCAYYPSDILNGNMIDDSAPTTLLALTDTQIFDSLNTFERMFASYTKNHLNTENKYILQNRTNNVFGYRGSTSNKSYFVQTQYDFFNLLRYNDGTKDVTRSFAFGQITIRVVNGSVESITQREQSDMLVMGSSNNFTVRSVRPCMAFLSSTNGDGYWAVSIQNSSNHTVCRLYRATDDQAQNRCSMFFPGFATVLHLANLTNNSFVVNVVAI